MHILLIIPALLIAYFAFNTAYKQLTGGFDLMAKTIFKK